MIIGYARVSTLEQNPDLQIDALKNAGAERIFIDTISGSTKERPELDKMNAILRPGDIVLVWRLDRLGLSLKNLINQVNQFQESDIAFKPLQENIDTSTSTGKLIFHVFGALAEFERNLIQERTKAGLASARVRGRYGGRPRKLDEKKIKRLRKLYNNKEMSVKEICERAGISKPTFYNYLKKS